MSAVERELIAFERKERELRKQERLERAAQKFPALVKELQSQAWHGTSQMKKPAWG
jgi:hypothetical protein